MNFQAALILQLGLLEHRTSKKSMKQDRVFGSVVQDTAVISSLRLNLNLFKLSKRKVWVLTGGLWISRWAVLPTESCSGQSCSRAQLLIVQIVIPDGVMELSVGVSEYLATAAGF